MQELQCFSGPDGYSKERSETIPARSATSGNGYYSQLIRRADSVPLSLIMKHYGLRTDNQNKKFVCPFPKHQNGRESTGSFQFYADTDSFWCFGCKTGRSSTQFVSNKEEITRVKAAFKILELYEDEALEDGYSAIKPLNYSERIEILMEFSSFVRDFIQQRPENTEAIRQIEQLTFALDRMNEKHTMDNEALKRYITELKTKVSE